MRVDDDSLEQVKPRKVDDDELEKMKGAKDESVTSLSMVSKEDDMAMDIDDTNEVVREGDELPCNAPDSKR
jgi:hypothetical protein